MNTLGKLELNHYLLGTDVKDQLLWLFALDCLLWLKILYLQSGTKSSAWCWCWKVRWNRRWSTEESSAKVKCGRIFCRSWSAGESSVDGEVRADCMAGGVHPAHPSRGIRTVECWRCPLEKKRSKQRTLCCQEINGYSSIVQEGAEVVELRWWTACCQCWSPL